MSLACVNVVNHRRAGIGAAAALSLLLAAASYGQGDDVGTEAPVADVDWEEIKRESREAIDVWSEAARAAARATWSAARTRVEDSWSATEEASGNTVDAMHDGSAAAIDSTRQGAEQVWADAAEESKQLWQQAKPKVAGAVIGAAREGGKALDAARQAGRTFWQVLTADDAATE